MAHLGKPAEGGASYFLLAIVLVTVQSRHMRSLVRCHLTSSSSSPVLPFFHEPSVFSFFQIVLHQCWIQQFLTFTKILDSALGLCSLWIWIRSPCFRQWTMCPRKGLLLVTASWFSSCHHGHEGLKFWAEPFSLGHSWLDPKFHSACWHLTSR